MKKRNIITAVIAVLLSVVSNNAFGYDIAVENADGKTIYYNYIKKGKELEVTVGGYSGAVVIPEEVTYMDQTRKVTTLGAESFQYCYGLTSITIPNSVTTIGTDAFSMCTGLTSITIPNSVTTIGKNAFWDCSVLTSVTIGNSVTTIGDYAFYNCSNLTSVTIPNSVTTIGNYAFMYCTHLTSITISNSITTISSSAFAFCWALTSVTIPNSVTTIGDKAFDGCYGLTSVSIPNSVTTIGSDAFAYCWALTSVTIPNSVTTIGSSAFYECPSLTSIVIGKSVTSIGNSAFYGCDMDKVVSLIENPSGITGKNSSAPSFSTFSQNTFNNATLYVPVGTIDKYKATAGWQDFQFIEEGVPSSILTPKSNPVLMQRSGNALTIIGAPANTPIAVYDLSGRLITSTKAAEGVTRVEVPAEEKVVIVKVGERSVKVAR